MTKVPNLLRKVPANKIHTGRGKFLNVASVPAARGGPATPLAVFAFWFMRWCGLSNKKPCSPFGKQGGKIYVSLNQIGPSCLARLIGVATCPGTRRTYMLLAKSELDQSKVEIVATVVLIFNARREWRGFLLWSIINFPTFCGQPNFRQVNAGLSFMRRIVADPQQFIVPHQTGITGIAAGRQFEEFSQSARTRIEP